MNARVLRSKCPARRAADIALFCTILTLPMTAGADEARPAETARILPEIVVSATMVPTASQAVGSAVTVITAEEIERKQVRVLSDVLREVPGLAVNRSGTVGTLTQVRIRGAEGNHTLVIIDGIEVNDPSGGSEFDFGQLRAADIERVEVLRGPQSALYGSDAVGGVINIVTKRGRGPAELGISAEGGSFATGMGSVSLRGGADKYHYSIGVTGYRTAGISIAPEDDGNTELDGNENATMNFKVGVTPLDNLSIDLFGRYVKDSTETDNQPSVAGIIKTVDAGNQTDTIQRSGGVLATYGLFDGAWVQSFGGAVHTDRADTRTNGIETFHADGDKWRFHYKSDLSFDTPDIAEARHGLTFLAEREDETQFTKSNFSTSDRDITNYGYVGEYRVSLWDRLHLTGGIRYDDNDIFNDKRTYRMTAAYVHHETGTRLHGSYGTGAKNPTLSELFGSTATYTGNPNLRPETSRGWDAGVEQGFLGDRLIADLTYFNNRITDLISGSGNTSVNLDGITKIQGVELSVAANLGHGLSLKGQYTYTDGQDANRKELVRRAKHIASMNLAYAFLDGKAKVDLGVDFNGVQRDTEFSNNYANSRSIKLDEFFLVNIAGSYEIKDGVELFARVENLFDQQYQEVLFYDEPGIAAYFGIRTRFGL